MTIILAESALLDIPATTLNPAETAQVRATLRPKYGKKTIDSIGVSYSTTRDDPKNPATLWMCAVLSGYVSIPLPKKVKEDSKGRAIALDALKLAKAKYPSTHFIHLLNIPE